MQEIKTRISKSEIRRKSEETEMAENGGRSPSQFLPFHAFWICFGFRYSDFGFFRPLSTVPPFPLGNFPRPPVASALLFMKRLLLSLALVFVSLGGARAQFGSFGDIPIEITSESTRVENGLAIAEQNVVIRYKDTAIYCDYGQYNPDTRDLFLSGNVRIYREGITLCFSIQFLK